MRETGFLFDDRGFGLNDLSWRDGRGDCCVEKDERETCPKKCGETWEKKNKNCADAKTAHCCKHVLRGSEAERTAFAERTGQADLPEAFLDRPYSASAAGNLALRNYGELAREVAKTASLVAVTVNSGQIRFVCTGEGPSASGFTDYMQYSTRTVPRCDGIEPPREESVQARYEIVSAYLQNIRTQEFVLMDLLYEKFFCQTDIVKSLKLCPVAEKTDLPEHAWLGGYKLMPDYAEAYQILKDTKLFSDASDPGLLTAYGMFWYYCIQLGLGEWRKLTGLKQEFENRGIDPISLLSADHPVPRDLKRLFKEAVGSSESFLRNSICRLYLQRYRPLKNLELISMEPTCRAFLWEQEPQTLPELAWRMLVLFSAFKRAMNRLEGLCGKRRELGALLTGEAPYSLEDFFAFQLWADMFSACACLRLLEKDRKQYKKLWHSGSEPTVSARWGTAEEEALRRAGSDCRERIGSVLRAFGMKPEDRWSRRFQAVFDWDAWQFAAGTEDTN